MYFGHLKKKKFISLIHVLFMPINSLRLLISRMMYKINTPGLVFEIVYFGYYY